jgi:hypothetical protein
MKADVQCQQKLVRVNEYRRVTVTGRNNKMFVKIVVQATYIIVEVL